MNNNRNKVSGITLIALVITIIVLLILAGVSIATLTGNNGIMQKTADAKNMTNKAKEVEQARLDIMSIITEKRGESPTEKEVKDIIEIYFTSVPESLEDLTQDLTTKEGGYSVKLSDVLEGITIIKEDKEENFVGYYADIDNDGKVDGIIYADMKVGNTKSGKWNGDDNSCYTVTKIKDKENVKEYKISSKIYQGQTTAGKYKANDGFGEKEVLVPETNSTGTKDRFYIMNLEDFTTAKYSSFYWYKSAEGNLSDTIEITTNDFGDGKANTIKEINRWNKGIYGDPNERDLWGVIQNKIDKQEENGIIVNCKWFIPSKSEWNAFGEELGITKNDYINKQLGKFYWTSTQGSETRCVYSIFL